MRAISGSMTSVLGNRSADVRGVHRAAAYTALAWSAVLLAWAVYNAFWQVGVGDFLRGIFYYGTGDDTGRAETANLNYGVVYIAAAVLILRGSAWGRGLATGVALIEGYNRLRSLTGALFDSRQQEYFRHTTEGELKLVTFALGFLVTAVLVLLLVRGVPEHEPWTPPANPWTQLAQQANQNPYQQQGYPQQAAAPAQSYPPYQQAQQPAYPYQAQQQPAPQAQAQAAQPAPVAGPPQPGTPQLPAGQQPVPPHGLQPAPQQPQPQPPANWQQPPSPGQ